MAQHDYNISNQTFPSFRDDLNRVLDAIKSSNSGNAAPSVTAPGMFWHDTQNNQLKMRNAADDDWITVFNFVGDTAMLRAAIRSTAGSVANPSVNFDGAANSGFYAAGVAIGVVSENVEAMRIAKTIISAYVKMVGPIFEISSGNGGFVGQQNDAADKPSFTWANALRSGMYRLGGGVGFAHEGAQLVAMRVSGMTSNVPVILAAPANSADAPPIVFSTSMQTGMGLHSAYGLSFMFEGVRKLGVNADGVEAIGVPFVGDGSGLTVLSSAVVRQILADANLAAVGTDAFLVKIAKNSAIVAGDYYSGAELVYGGVYGDDSGDNVAVSNVSPSGTWRALGSAPAVSGKRGGTSFRRS